MMTEFTFYQIECNDKRYVGHTTNFQNRMWEHKSNCYNEKRPHYNLPIYQYIRANGGWNSCQISVIEICNFETKRDACMREEYWRIEKEATLNSQRCYLSDEMRLQNDKNSRKIYYELNRNKIKQIDRARWQFRKDDHNKKSKQKRLQKRLKKQMLIELLKIAVLL